MSENLTTDQRIIRCQAGLDRMWMDAEARIPAIDNLASGPPSKEIRGQDLILARMLANLVGTEIRTREAQRMTADSGTEVNA